MRKTLLNIITVIGAIIAVVTGVYTIYHEAIEDKNPLVSITIDKAERVTRLSKVIGLETSYSFKKRKINDLWVVDMTMKNISNATIIGTGDKKNIIGDSLLMVVSSPYRLLDGTFTQADFDDMTLTSKADTVVSFKFVQWRPKEAVKIRFYIEGDTSIADAPVFWMNDRQIIDGKVTYEKYDNTEYKGLLPSKIKNNSILFGLGVTAMFVFIEAFVIMIITFGEYCFRLYKYRNWKAKYYVSYKSQVGVLFASNALLKEYEPYTLPMEFWPQITGIPKPKKTARDNQISLDFILAFLVCLGTLIGILWIFPANWVN